MTKSKKYLSILLLTVILLIITLFSYRFFEEIINNSILNSFEESNGKLGVSFFISKLLFMIVSCAGFIACILLFIKKHNRANGFIIYLVLLNLFYSAASYLWIVYATRISDESVGQTLENLTDILNPDSQSSIITFGIETTQKALVRNYYLTNTINAAITFVACCALAFIKTKIDKKDKLNESQFEEVRNYA